LVNCLQVLDVIKPVMLVVVIILLTWHWMGVPIVRMRVFIDWQNLIVDRV
jgi:hypothetical protein